LQEFGYYARQTVGPALSITKVNQDIFALNVAQIPQRYSNRIRIGSGLMDVVRLVWINIRSVEFFPLLAPQQ
jgi:hypothetical protein